MSGSAAPSRSRLAGTVRKDLDMDAALTWTQVKLDQKSFVRLVAMVSESCGIRLSDMKQTMLETRLRRRLLINELDSFADYVDLLSTPEGQRDELQSFIDAVVTNETSFFRERAHFDYLTPAMLRRLAEGAPDERLKMWSAATSSGEEPYSLAMIADEASMGGTQWGWSVLATDISIRVLEAARNAVYTVDGVAGVPDRLRQRYILKSANPDSREVRIAEEIRRQVRFGQINLMHADYHLPHRMDVIFCRNVLIYFEPRTQTEVIEKLTRHLRPGGLLFLGHSDTLRSKDLPLRLIRNNIYERLED